MTLNDKFERIVVLNLPYKEDRKARLLGNIESTGIADPRSLKWITAISGDWMPPPAWWNAGNGAWGCAFSHVMAIAQAIMDKVDSLLILEDDATFAANSAELLERFSADWPKTWGQIYLGGQHLKDPKPVSKHWLAAVNVNRTHCYAVHSSAMAKMTAHCLYAPDYMARRGWHIDHQLGIAHERKDWPVLAPKWWIAGQAADKSNISGKENRELWWQPVKKGFPAPIVILPPQMKNDDPVFQKFCHAGCNLYRDTCEDVGADKAKQQNGGIHRFLNVIAEEAIWNHRLPAVQHPDFTEEAVKKAWRGKVIAPAVEEIPRLHSDLMQKLYADALK